MEYKAEDDLTNEMWNCDLVRNVCREVEAPQCDNSGEVHSTHKHVT